MGRRRMLAAANRLDGDAAAIIAAMTVPPNAARRSLINDTVLALKAAGVWSLLDCLWVMAAHDEQAGRLNWKAPASFTLAANGVITFTADRGWQGNGSTGYLDTGWIPATHGVNYTLNDASLGVYSRMDTADASVDVGARDTATVNNRSFLQARTVGGDLVGVTNMSSGTVASATVATSASMSAIRRASATQHQVMRNGSAVDTATANSTSVPQFPIFIGAVNTGGIASNLSSRQYALAFTAAAMSEAQQLALYNVFQGGYLADVEAAV